MTFFENLNLILFYIFIITIVIFNPYIVSKI